jgi:hypothetical protein
MVRLAREKIPDYYINSFRLERLSREYKTH